RLGVERIDLYYVHRINRDQSIEDTMGGLSRLVEEGKIDRIGLCEVSAETLRRTHAVHPVTAVQTEYSLWTREVEAEILPTCRELGIGFVPYSPLGRGFLTGRFQDGTGFEDGDFRAGLPRFQAEAAAANRRIAELVNGIAARKGCSAAQLSLAWLLAQGDDIVPIPGTKSGRGALYRRGDEGSGCLRQEAGNGPARPDPPSQLQKIRIDPAPEVHEVAGAGWVMAEPLHRIGIGGEHGGEFEGQRA
ncbi:MAG: aldo/keto reductase, partial [Maritimibacter sp.]